jgi:hypothetical protein
LSTLLRAHQAVIPVARMLAGRQMIEYPCEVHLQRSSRLGCKFLSGLLLLVLGVTDMRTGGAALARGDVRLRQAIGEFAGLGLNALVKTSHLLRLIIQQQLGERVTKPDLMACKGATQPLDRLVTVLIATMSTRNAIVPSVRAVGATLDARATSIGLSTCSAPAAEPFRNGSGRWCPSRGRTA